MNTLRILLADDHTLVRAGIRSLLEGMPDVEVVGEAADGAAAVELARSTTPDIVLMDIAMKGKSGLEATTHLRAAMPNIRVIILSMYATADYVEQALRAGATGYLLKDAATLELALAIEAVARGEIYLSPAISKQVVAGFLERKEPQSDALTPRQAEILVLIAQGFQTKEIAFRLGVSGKTVETHRAQLMDRLDIHDVAGLVRYAIRSGRIKAE